MSDSDLSLIAHLMRRAGFGANRDELESYAGMGYEALVEDLLHPELFPEIEDDVLQRYYGTGKRGFVPAWTYRMINAQRPLQEKMTLWCHHVFATSQQKSGHDNSSHRQIEMFRRHALSDLRTLLIELSKDPAMVFWLDNNENLKDEPNENYGRELLELFSMGVENYTEEDVKEVARAFTGWSLTTPLPFPMTYGGHPTHFAYRAEDHDDGAKSFLGELGRFNGEDIVDVIVRQPATARFICRHLYMFFVADEPPVASWNEVPPLDPGAIASLVMAYMESDGDFRTILRVLFNSDFFKEARFKKVKSPIELVMGVAKLAGTYREPDPGINDYFLAANMMGQLLLQPLSVEGWHTGQEWIDGGTLNQRINFAFDEVGDADKPGVWSIIERLRSEEKPLTPEQLVDRCLDLAGPLQVSAETRGGLVKYAESGSELRLDGNGDRTESESRVVRVLQLIVATREYQFG